MQRKEIKTIYVEKINKLKKYDKAYFEQDSPLISDQNYDNIKQEILRLERKIGNSFDHRKCIFLK